jgi:hypothetical protein
LILAAAALIISLSGCQKDIYGCTDPYAYNYNRGANISNGSCTYYGDVTFWFGSNMANATVTINGQSAVITQYYPNGAPSCNAVGCANFTLPVGTYAYTATSSQYTWGYTTPIYATVTANGCATYLLQ